MIYDVNKSAHTLQEQIVADDIGLDPCDPSPAEVDAICKRVRVRIKRALLACRASALREAAGMYHASQFAVDVGRTLDAMADKAVREIGVIAEDGAAQKPAAGA